MLRWRLVSLGPLRRNSVIRESSPAMTKQAKLFRADLGILDDLGPAQPVLGDQRGQPFGRAALRGQTLLVERCPNAWLRQDLVENSIVAVDDLLRRTGRSKHAIPEIDVEIGDAEFGQRRHLRRLLRPGLAADSQDSDVSRFYEWERGMNRQEHRRDVSARE